MKKYTSAMVAGLAAIAIAGSASAQTVIRITGSSAYRPMVHAAITNLIGNDLKFAVVSGKTLNNTGYSEFTGTLKSTNVVVDIQCAFSGSLDGVIRIAGAVARTDWPSFAGNVGSLTAGGNASIPSAGGTGSGVADGAFSDAFASSTGITGPHTVTEQTVGVVSFVWARNIGSPNSITNMSVQLATQLLSSGQLPLAQFSGNLADTNVLVRVVGRNADSGTRLNTFAETGFGIGTQPAQQQVTIAGGVATDVHAYPSDTLFAGTAYQKTYGLGVSGYSSGGNLASALNATGSDTAGTHPGWLVGYISVGDASSASPALNQLTYNGVGYSLAGVKSGQYAFWSYEHLDYNETCAGVQKSFLDSLALDLQTVDGENSTFGGALLNNMTVGRGGDGGQISATY